MVILYEMANKIRLKKKETKKIRIKRLWLNGKKQKKKITDRQRENMLLLLMRVINEHKFTTELNA